MRGGGYETKDDLLNEQAIAAVLEDKWKCAARKMRVSYKLDFALTRIIDGVEQVFAFCEVKCPRYSWQMFEHGGGYRISFEKWMAAERLCKAAGVPFMLVVSAEGDTRYLKTSEFDHDGIVWNGRADRGDPDDMEPMACLDVRRFRSL